MPGTVNEHKETIKRLCDLIEKEQEQIRIIAPTDNAWEDALEKTKKKSAENFTILIMGTFSSGKSTMINALIGEDLLPSGFLPETAVIGELHYGTKKSVTLYPKKGMWKGGDQPFQLEQATPEEISRYASIDNEEQMNRKQDDSDRIESPFEKMVITWPLEILKDGVVIVDSPGTDDPYSHDEIVQSYIPRADAMIYLMKGLDAYTQGDKNALQDVNKVGIRNIIFGITYYDVVAMQYKGKESRLKTFLDVIQNHCKNHTNLGDEGIHFLASLDALKAKLTEDQELLERSGYAELEKYINRYLVENKGRDQVRNIVQTIRYTAQEAEKQVHVLNAALDKSEEDVKKDIERAEAELEIARNDARNVKRNFRNALNNLKSPARTKISDFIGGVAGEVDLDDFEPVTKLPTGMGKLNPIQGKKAATALQEEYRDEFNRRLNKRTNEWISTQLSSYIQRETETTAKDMRESLENFAAQLNRIDSVMVGGDIALGGSGTVSSIALGLSYALLTGDWFTGGMSAVYGKGAFARTLGFQAATGVALGVAMLFGAPVTLPIMAVAGIGASILAILTGKNEKKELQIKKKVLQDCRSFYGDDKEHQASMVNSIMVNVDSFIEQICSDMDDALEADIDGKEKLIQRTLDSLKADVKAKQQEKEIRNGALDAIRLLLKDVDEICRMYGIE